MASYPRTKLTGSVTKSKPASRLSLEHLEDRLALATWTVTDLGDSGGFQGSPGQLRGILNSAAAGDVINFAVTGTITLNPQAGGAVRINKDVSILGPGASQLTVRYAPGQAIDSVFTVEKPGATVVLSGLTITGGIGTGFLNRVGGGIFNNQGDLTVRDCVITGNRTDNNPTVGSLTTTAAGAGIFNMGGNLTVERCLIENNSAAIPNTGTWNGFGDGANTPYQMAGGGGIGSEGGTLTVRDSVLRANAAGEGARTSLSPVLGGGIYAYDTDLLLVGSTVEGNTLQGTQDVIGAGVAAVGGEVRIERSSISRNTSTGLEITNPGPATNNSLASAAGLFTGMYTGMSIATGTLFTGTAGPTGSTTMVDTTIEDNTATNFAGVRGVGIRVSGISMEIRGSTISGNTGAAGRGNAEGGGVWFAGGSLTVENSTVANNSITGQSSSLQHTEGGGIFNSGDLTLRNVTVTGNSASKRGGGLADGVGGTASVGNSIVAGNSAGEDGLDIHGDLTSLGHNLIGNSAGATGFVASDLLNVAAGLDPAGLKNNGGPTRTVALLPSSAAIDAGDNALASGYTLDQRGAARIANGTVDIGAFEYHKASTSAVVTASANPSQVGQSVIFTATVTSAVGVPSGTVTFKNGSATLGTGTLTAGVATFATAALPLGTHAISVVYAGDAGHDGTTSASLSMVVVAAPSSGFSGLRIDDGNRQRSMVRSITLTLASPIGSANLPALLASLSLTRAGGGAVSMTGTLSGSFVTLRFSGAGIVGGSLADGRYSLTRDGVEVLALHRLFGDLDGNATVDNSESQVMSSIANNTRRGFSASYNAYLDFNSNGIIQLDDRDQFSRRLGTSI